MKRIDPALEELERQGDPEDIIPVILRLLPGRGAPKKVRPVSKAGDIVTGRMKRGDIRKVRSQVASLKAPRSFSYEPRLKVQKIEAKKPFRDKAQDPRLRDYPFKGKGIVVGVLDYSLDITHPDFCNPDGSSRVLALWDQRGGRHRLSPEPYRYGRHFTREMINKALTKEYPLKALDYRISGKSHGTHVTSIAAGSGKGGAPAGIACQADIVFVHLSNINRSEQENLGDSASTIEAVDFIRKIAGDRPFVINASIGAHGGPHDGSTGVERYLTNFLRGKKGRAFCQSTGNYWSDGIHSKKTFRESQTKTFTFTFKRSDISGGEVELWYSGADEMEVSIIPPRRALIGPVKLGDRHYEKDSFGKEVFALYHRNKDPLNGKHHIDIFFRKTAPRGHWKIRLKALKVSDGRVDAWIERDPKGLRHQSKFIPRDRDPKNTTGTIAHSPLAITTGAIDKNGGLAKFSSSGPALSGIRKPNLVAPGVGIVAARSNPGGTTKGSPKTTQKSGTSMASPQVTGTVAAMFEAAGMGNKMPISKTRKILFETAIPPQGGDKNRLGHGLLNPEKAIQVAKTFGKERKGEVAMTKRPGVELIPPSQVNFLAFEGGGGKGFAFLGAVKALEEIGILKNRAAGKTFLLPKEGGQITGIAGASAGAITAFLLSMGLNSASVQRIMKTINFTQFFDPPSPGREVLAKTGPVGGNPQSTLATLLDLPAKARREALGVIFRWFAGGRLDPPLDRVLDPSKISGYLESLKDQFGTFAGWPARTIFDGLLRKRLEEEARESNPAFTNADFRTHFDVFGIKLAITGSNLSTGKSEVFSVDTTPDFPVADAVRISMGLPFIFKPVIVDHRNLGQIWQNRQGQKIIPSKFLKGFWVDGGVFNNAPLRFFGLGGKTVIFLLGDEAPKYRFKGIFDYAGNYFKTTALSGKRNHISRTWGTDENAITLSTQGLSLLDFDPPQAILDKVTERSRKKVRDEFSQTIGENIPAQEAPEVVQGLITPPQTARVNPAKVFSDVGFNPSGSGEISTSVFNPLDAFAAKGAADGAMKLTGRLFPGVLAHNNAADAFRHAVWNVKMTRAIGASEAKKFADGHEISGPNPIEERLMDLINNHNGRILAGQNPGVADWRVVQNALRKGQLQTVPVRI